MPGQVQATYVSRTMLCIRGVMRTSGLVRSLDRMRPNW
jgi:hypothetical protein